MKILVVSDSHGDNKTLKSIAAMHPDCDYYFHCGDAQANQEDVAPFAAVRGNCDYMANNLPKYLLVNTKEGLIVVEHIPFYLFTLEDLKKKNCLLYLVGHTHIKDDKVAEGIRIVNPGAIVYPRDGSKSYAIININNKVIQTTFYKIK